MSEAAEIEPYAMWTPDCQGKQDFDGPIISVSTRYYPGPGGGGFMQMDISNGSSVTTTQPYGPQPTAHAAIHLRVGPREEHDGGGNYLIWKQKEFAAETEAGVKAQVEAWTRDMMGEIIANMGGLGAFKG